MKLKQICDSIRTALKAADKMLGCNYSHLRRVAAGSRKSDSLLARYRQLQRVRAIVNKTTTP